MLTQKSWQQLIRAGVPETLVVSRRPLHYGDRVLAVGESIGGVVPAHRMRPLYDARLIGLADPQAPPAIQAKGKSHGIQKRETTGIRASV